MLVFGISFVVALNIAARLDHPDGVLVGEVDGRQVIWRLESVGPGGAIGGLPPGFSITQAEDEIYSANLDRLRAWSLLSVVGLAIASGIGGYVLSGMMLRPVRDITRVASQISATDLSHRINHEGPDDELKELADTFDSMIDRLENSFEQQRQFVQDASHELRTPLAAIRTNIEVAEMDPNTTTDEYRELLETVKLQTERLTRLSDDLLLLSANESHEQPLEEVLLAEVAADVVRELGPVAATQNMVVHAEGDPQVSAIGNADRLYRCVFNLVDNAIKYAGPGASITVTYGVDGARARIAVKDTGPGIAQQDQARIFDRFYRVDKGRSRRQGGTGLGLAIVRELAESMDGKVSLVSAPGEGAEFTITLGLPPPEPEALPRPAPDVAVGQPLPREM